MNLKLVRSVRVYVYPTWSWHQSYRFLQYLEPWPWRRPGKSYRIWAYCRSTAAYSFVDRAIALLWFMLSARCMCSMCACFVKKFTYFVVKTLLGCNKLYTQFHLLALRWHKISFNASVSSELFLFRCGYMTGQPVKMLNRLNDRQSDFEIVLWSTFTDESSEVLRLRCARNGIIRCHPCACPPIDNENWPISARKSLQLLYKLLTTVQPKWTSCINRPRGRGWWKKGALSYNMVSYYEGLRQFSHYLVMTSQLR